jgi:hypothetical protein
VKWSLESASKTKNEDEDRGGELLAAVPGLEQVLKEVGVLVQTPHNMKPKNAAL